MSKFAAVCTTVGVFGVFMLGIGFSMDAAVDSVLKDCTQLGGFRHEDKVYVCTRIRPQPVRGATHEVPLTPELAEGGEEAEQP